jgi:autotransporter-associated beta strand protein
VFDGTIPDVTGNGNTLSVWEAGGNAGYQYRTDVPFAIVPKTGAANNFSVKNTGGGPAMFTTSSASLPTGVDVETMTPSAFTIEVSYKPENGGFRTVVGRDAQNVSTSNASLAALYVQARPDNSIGIEFTDAAGNTHDAFSPAGVVHGFDFGTDPDGTTGTWYNLAAVSDGSTLKMYVNGALVASTPFTSADPRLAIGTTSGGDWHAGEFSVGRGLFNGGHTDRAYGYIDEVRISNTALATNQLLVPITSKLFTWINAGSGAFGVTSNWDLSSVPTDVQFHQALINNGGTASISGSGSFNMSDLWVGSGSSGVGHVVQTGAAATVGLSLRLGQLGGTGDYDLAGGTLNTAGVTVAGGGTTLNTATLTVHGNAVMNVNGALNVAGGGGTLNTGTMIVRENGIVNVTTTGNQPVGIGNVGTALFVLQDSAQFNTGVSEFWVGNGSTFSNSTANISGGTLNVNNWLAVGRDRSTGVLNLSGTGAINKTGGGNITIGAVDNGTFFSTGTVNQTGGAIVSLRNPADPASPGIVGGEVYLGETTRGKGTWNFSAGTASAPVINVGYSGQGTLNMSGTAQMTADFLGVARAGTFGGTANLNGGTITTGQVFRGGSSGPAQVNFNGTTLIPSSDNDRFVAGFNANDLVLKAGGAIIDTNGHNIGIDSGFSGSGSLIKNGAGVMTINAGANSTHSGPTVINVGTVKLQRVTANNSLLAKNVAAYYKFDDAGNIGKDSSPSGNDVSDVFGTATISTTTAPPNHAASLSLPSNFTNQDFLSTTGPTGGSVPSNFPTGNSSYTLAAWINVDNTNTNFTNGIIGWGTEAGGTARNAITFRTRNNGGTPNGLLNGWFASDQTANLAAGSTLVNQWHHVVAEYDAATDIRRIYVDGNLLGTGLLPGINNAGTQNFRIGMAVLGEPFSGNMADLFVAGSALSQAQIQQLINSGVTFGTFTGASGALSPNSLVQVASGAMLDLNGASTPSGGLGNVGAGGGLVTSSAAGSAVLGLNPVGTASFSGVIEDGAGTVGITKSGAGAQVLSGNNTYTGTTTVQGGALVLSSDGSQATVFTAGRGGADIQGGRVVFDYNTATDHVAQIKTMLHDGFNEPTKFATGAIRSSTATSAIGLGYINDAAAKQMTVAYAYYGDSNLDGKVNALDFNAVATNFGQSGKEWVQGDFNYDGAVNSLDFNALAGNFNQALPAPAPALGALVPEPGALVLLPVAFELVSRRRRGRG